MKFLLILCLGLAVSFKGFTQTSLEVDYVIENYQEGDFYVEYTSKKDNEVIHFVIQEYGMWADTIELFDSADIHVSVKHNGTVVYESDLNIKPEVVNYYYVHLSQSTWPNDYDSIFKESYEQNMWFGSNIFNRSPDSRDLQVISINYGFGGYNMLTNSLGALIYGEGNYDIVSFKKSSNNQKKRYNYTTVNSGAMVRFLPFGFRNSNYWKRNFHVDLGASYYFPLRFRYVTIQNNLKVKEKNLVTYNDFRINARIGIGPLAFFANYRLNNVIKRTGYLQMPTFTIGFGMNAFGEVLAP